MKKKIGVYAGSFNPFHIGHEDIVKQSKDLFDEVIVAVGINPEKSQTDKEPLPDFSKMGVKLVHFGGLLADYLNVLSSEREDAEIFLIRGIRNGDDLQYEQNQLQFIREMYPTLKTTFFICNKNLEHISSSALRNLKKVSLQDYLKYVVR